MLSPWGYLKSWDLGGHLAGEWGFQHQRRDIANIVKSSGTWKKLKQQASQQKIVGQWSQISLKAVNWGSGSEAQEKILATCCPTLGERFPREPKSTCLCPPGKIWLGPQHLPWAKLVIFPPMNHTETWCTYDYCSLGPKTEAGGLHRQILLQDSALRPG